MGSNNITIRRAGQYTTVMPPVDDRMRLFTTTKHVAVDDARHGVKIVHAPLPLAWPNELHGIPVTETYAGLEPRIKIALEAAGYEVELKGIRPGSMPRPRKPQSGGFDTDNGVLEFVRREERGLIRYDPAHVYIDRLIAQIAEAYPKARILVIASRQNDVLHLHRRLSERGLPAGRAFYGRQSPGTYRIAVTTPSSVGTGLADAANRDVVIYVNPAEAFGRWGILGLESIGPARVYGLMPEGFNPPNPTNDLVTMVFGDESVRVPKHGSTARPVQVVFVASRVNGNMVAKESDLDVRRRLVWHHPVRNRRIAQIAVACTCEECDKLENLASGLGWAARERENGYVGVLVESVEHALELRRHLPGWPVLNGGLEHRRWPRSGHRRPHPFPGAAQAASVTVPDAGRISPDRGRIPDTQVQLREAAGTAAGETPGGTRPANHAAADRRSRSFGGLFSQAGGRWRFGRRDRRNLAAGNQHAGLLRRHEGRKRERTARHRYRPLESVVGEDMAAPEDTSATDPKAGDRRKANLEDRRGGGQGRR
jgi:hypothetical protein